MTDRDNNSREQRIDKHFTFFIFSGTGYLFLECLSGPDSQIHLFSSGPQPQSPTNRAYCARMGIQL